MWTLYNLLFALFALCYLPVFIAKGKFGKGGLARFGSLSPALREALAGRRVVWVHAVSVGEMGLAVSLAGRLRDRIPDTKILFTTTTAAGFAVGSKIKDEEDLLSYFPADFPWSVSRFLDAVNPALFIMLETELWPNLLKELSRRGVPSLVVNGRISDRAFGRYLGIRFFLKRVLRKIDGISVQDERMRSRFAALGASADQIAVNGNLKYDWEPSPHQEAAAAGLKRALRAASGHLLVAGSTHEGEEEALFAACAEVRKTHERAGLLVAPRHPERLASIEKAALAAGLRARRVRANALDALAHPEKDEVWVLDQVGILAPLYECADLVFVGGSLVPVGGHNPAEPAFYAKPVLFGPYMNNFFEMASELKANHAATEISDVRALARVWSDSLRDPQGLRASGRAAQDLIRRHQGATQRNVEWILAFLGSRERSFVKI